MEPMKPSENPYQGPSAEEPNNPPNPEDPPSSIPKVIGIIHIVYAAIGGLAALAGLGSGVFATAVLDPLKEQGEETGQNMEPVIEAFDGLMRVSLIQSAVSAVLAIVLLIAGIQLLKYRLPGRKLSNVWALARIVTAIPLTFMALSAQSELQEALQSLSQSNQFTEMASLMSTGGIMGIVGVLVVCAYPVVSLIFVNQDKTKSALK